MSETDKPFVPGEEVVHMSLVSPLFYVGPSRDPGISIVECLTGSTEKVKTESLSRPDSPPEEQFMRRPIVNYSKYPWGKWIFFLEDIITTANLRERCQLTSAAITMHIGKLEAAALYIEQGRVEEEEQRRLRDVER